MQCRPTARENHLTQTSFSWLPVPAVQELGYLEITDVNTADDKVIVKGDAGSLSGIGQRYWLIAPAGVDPATGAIETDPCKMGSLWLWAGYLYRAPIVGFHTTPPSQSAGTYGAQTGNNKLGSYYCWNRIYEPATGRWTTPDPAKSPWSNLLGFCAGTPIQKSDPTGLVVEVEGSVEYQRAVWGAIYTLCPHADTTSDVNSGKPQYPSTFCDEYAVIHHGGRIEMVEGWSGVDGHTKGCELVGRLMCGCCKVTIKDEGRDPHYRADSWKDAQRKGHGMSGSPHGPSRGSDPNLAEMGRGTGTGTNGMVSIKRGHVESGMQVHGYATGSGNLPGTVLLAHELAHALRGCQGNSYYAEGRVDLELPSGGVSVAPGGGVDPWEDLPAGSRFRYGSREEYDVINEWENPIHREIAGRNAPQRQGHN